VHPQHQPLKRTDLEQRGVLVEHLDPTTTIRLRLQLCFVWHLHHRTVNLTVPTATACLNLTVSPRRSCRPVHGACQDPRTIYSTDQIGWRYYTKDLQWIAIEDLRWGENDGTWMFLPSNSQVLNTVCHSSGCWWIG
jgi:hypothetical protein